jgi:thiol-disulfide isomerase/thioredoxin
MRAVHRLGGGELDRMKVAVALWLAAAAGAAGDIVGEVRAAIARRDLDAAERAARAWRGGPGATAETAEAFSWLARACLAEKQWDRAGAFAAETRTLALELLQARPLDADRRLPLALGASIEVEAQVMAARGARAEAVAFLDGELARWGATSIHERIRKNIHLLSLEGKPAPPLESVVVPRGKPVLLFFWAHWCPDCKNQATVLARIASTYGPRGLVLISPTRLYGYAARGAPADPQQETRYIASVWERDYPELRACAVPITSGGFRTYGASTIPTLVLIDRQGIVRLYRPGAMTESELAASVSAVVGP